jgi:hypothetical protein
VCREFSTVVYSEKKAVLDTLVRQASVRAVHIISNCYYGRTGFPEAPVAILEDRSVAYLAKFCKLQRFYRV